MKCDDGSKCTNNDHCNKAVCRSNPIDCDDANACTKDTCEAKTGGANAVIGSSGAAKCDGSTFEGRCYKGIKTQLSWDAAETECGKWGGHLASAASAEENAHILKVFLDLDEQLASFWIGLSDTVKQGQYLWIDGTVTNYLNWSKDANYPLTIPMRSGAAMHYQKATWINANKAAKRPSVCERPLPGPQLCDDGNACTVTELCIKGVCNAGAARNCNDQNPCTNDVCAKDFGCKNTDNTSPCSDGDNCTKNDACKGGKCVADPVHCADGKECTDDSCNKTTGCVFSQANTGDACSKGICQLGNCVEAGARGIKRVALGRFAGYGIGKDDKVRAWGKQIGQLLGPTVPKSDTPPYKAFEAAIPKALAVIGGTTIGCFMDMDGLPVCMGASSGTISPTPVDINTRIVEMAGYANRVCGLGPDGKVLCWAADKLKAVDEGLKKPAAFIAVGKDHTCAVHPMQVQMPLTYSCWGKNTHYQLGQSQVAKTAVKTAASPATGGYQGQGFALVGACAGDAFTCIATDSAIRCWGDDAYGKLGYFAEGSTPVPGAVVGFGQAKISGLACGTNHACAIANGAVKCWGRNHEGQLGNGTTADQPAAVAAAGLTGITAIAAFENTTCARKGTDEVVCWGSNDNETLLLYKDGKPGDHLIASPVSNGSTPLGKVVALARGYRGNCAAMTGEQSGFSYKCWGDNPNGNGLGVPSLQGPVMQAFDAPVNAFNVFGLERLELGEQHGCMGDFGDGITFLRCWGNNTYYRVTGQGKTSDKLNSRSQFPDTRITSFAVGAHHTCIAPSNGNKIVKCWGRGDSGQTGDAQFTQSTKRTEITGMGNVRMLTAGKAHTCALDTSDLAWCWGSNQYGQLGSGSTAAKLATRQMVGGSTFKWGSISAGHDFNCGIRKGGAQDGQVWCWGHAGFSGVKNKLGDRAGKNSNVPVKVLGLSNKAIKVSSGGHSSCAIDVVGNLWCWGFTSSYGLIGHQSSFGISDVSKQPFKALGPTGTPLANVSAVAVSAQHACVIVAKQAYCWGDRDHGRLGTDTAWSWSPVPVASWGP